MINLCKCGCKQPVTYNVRKKKYNIFLKGHYNKTKHFNRQKFKSIRNEEDAYWLGFFIADGFVKNKGTFGFHLHEKDSEHLDKYVNYLESEYKPSKYGTNGYRLEISDKPYVINVLKPLGLIQGKSKSISIPSVEKNLLHHLIRGIFDGDGWICKCKNNQGAFGIIGNIQIIEFIQKELIKYGMNQTTLRIDKRHKGGWIRTISYGGIGNIKKLYRYLYKRAKIFLNRKEQIWKTLLNLQQKNF